jgi:IclR family pca regulon transcriptional regulator
MDLRHERNYLKTLARGLRVLTAFTPVKPELSLTDIAEFLNVDPSTASRFTYTLQELGYLERDPQTRLYRVTPQVYAFAISLVGPRNLRQVGLPHMERLRERTGETVVLSVRDGIEIVIVEVVETHQTLAPRGWVGGRAPVYCSAMGKAMLAHLPEPELALALDAVRFTPRTPNTITNRLDLLKQRRIPRGGCFRSCSDFLWRRQSHRRNLYRCPFGADQRPYTPATFGGRSHTRRWQDFHAESRP